MTIAASDPPMPCRRASSHAGVPCRTGIVSTSIRVAPGLEGRPSLTPILSNIALTEQVISDIRWARDRNATRAESHWSNTGDERAHTGRVRGRTIEAVVAEVRTWLADRPPASSRFRRPMRPGVSARCGRCLRPSREPTPGGWSTNWRRPRSKARASGSRGPQGAIREDQRDSVRGDRRRGQQGHAPDRRPGSHRPGYGPRGAAAGPTGRSRDRGDLAGSTRRRGRRARQTGPIRRHSPLRRRPVRSRMARVGQRGDFERRCVHAASCCNRVRDFAVSSGVGTQPGCPLVRQIGALN